MLLPSSEPTSLSRSGPYSSTAPGHLPAGGELDARRLLLLPVGDLFLLAQAFATRSDFSAKEFIYEQVIRAHPEARPLDIVRLDIAAADRVRRAGDYQRAIESLELIRIPEESDGLNKTAWTTAHCDRLNALAWAKFYLAKSSDKPDIYSDAISVGDQVAIFASAHRSNIPAERLCQALESSIGLRVSCGRELDSIFEPLERYRAAVEEIADQHLKTRGISQYHAALGESLLKLGRNSEAVVELKRYVDMCEAGLGNYYKIGAAIPYLVALNRSGNPSAHGTFTISLAQYIASVVPDDANTRDAFRDYLAELGKIYECLSGVN